MCFGFTFSGLVQRVWLVYAHVIVNQIDSIKIIVSGNIFWFHNPSF